MSMKRAMICETETCTTDWNDDGLLGSCRRRQKLFVRPNADKTPPYFWVLTPMSRISRLLMLVRETTRRPEKSGSKLTPFCSLLYITFSVKERISKLYGVEVEFCRTTKKSRDSICYEGNGIQWLASKWRCPSRAIALSLRPPIFVLPVPLLAFTSLSPSVHPPTDAVPANLLAKDSVCLVSIDASIFLKAKWWKKLMVVVYLNLRKWTENWPSLLERRRSSTSSSDSDNDRNRDNTKFERRKLKSLERARHRFLPLNIEAGDVRSGVIKVPFIHSLLHPATSILDFAFIFRKDLELRLAEVAPTSIQWASIDRLDLIKSPFLCKIKKQLSCKVVKACLQSWTCRLAVWRTTCKLWRKWCSSRCYIRMFSRNSTWRRLEGSFSTVLRALGKRCWLVHWPTSAVAMTKRFDQKLFAIFFILFCSDILGCIFHEKRGRLLKQMGLANRKDNSGELQSCSQFILCEFLQILFGKGSFEVFGSAVCRGFLVKIDKILACCSTKLIRCGRRLYSSTSWTVWRLYEVPVKIRSTVQ